MKPISFRFSHTDIAKLDMLKENLGFDSNLDVVRFCMTSCLAMNISSTQPAPSISRGDDVTFEPVLSDPGHAARKAAIIAQNQKAASASTGAVEVPKSIAALVPPKDDFDPMKDDIRYERDSVTL